MTRPRRLIAWLTVAGVGVTTAAAATTFWLVSRPTEQAGEPLASLRAAAPAAEPTDRPAPEPSRASPDQASTLPRPSTRPADLDAVAREQQLSAPPVRLTVASLGIEADIDPVGVEADGSMTIPKSASRVGWYRYGPAPEDPAGNTVLAGHVDTAEEGPGALFQLRNVEVGARIVVTDADGTTHEYEVAGKESVVKAALPVEEIFARDGRPLLVLVTCGGDFQPELRSYRDNVVVTAVPVTGVA